jgi:hypothetical protein
MSQVWIVTYEDPRDAQDALHDIGLSNYPFYLTQEPLVRNVIIVHNASSAYQESELSDIFGRYGRLVQIAPVVFPEAPITADDNVHILYSSDLFSHLWPSGLFTDLTLHVDNRYFQVHRAVLSSVSDYFKVILTRMSEAQQNTIQLHEIDADIFEQLLTLIYQGNLPVYDLSILSVMQLVQYFQIKGVDLEHFVDRIPFDVITSENFVQYVMELSQMFPHGFSRYIINLILEQMPPDMDVSSLPPELQQRLSQ